MIVLCGKSGSGKSLIAKHLEEMGIQRIVTYTTRPMRDGEIDGVDYHFVTEGKFLLMKSYGQFLETTEYKVANGQIWLYGTPFKELDENKLAILNPRGVKEIKYHTEYNPMIFYLFTEDGIRYDRLQNRGDNSFEIHRRMLADDYDFYKIGELADYHIPNNNCDSWLVATNILYLYNNKRRQK